MAWQKFVGMKYYFPSPLTLCFFGSSNWSRRGRNSTFMATCQRASTGNFLLLQANKGFTYLAFLRLNTIHNNASAFPFNFVLLTVGVSQHGFRLKVLLPVSASSVWVFGSLENNKLMLNGIVTEESNHVRVSKQS